MNEVLRQYFDWDQARPYFGDLARGFWVTLQIAFFAELICLSLGMLLALMRQAGRTATTPAGRIGGTVLRGIAIVYINVFRALPALLVLLLMAGLFPRAPALPRVPPHGVHLPVPADPGDPGPHRVPDRLPRARHHLRRLHRGGV